MNSIEKIETENIKTAFDTVTKAYKKTASLLTDFADELAIRGFEHPKYRSNYAGPDGQSWLMRCTELHFESQQETDKKLLIAVMISFSNVYTAEITEPRLVAGVLAHTGQDEGWLYAAYYNEGDGYAYSPKGEWEDGEIIDFSLIGDQKKRGCFFAKPLFQVNNTEAVKVLSEKLVTLSNDFETAK